MCQKMPELFPLQLTADTEPKGAISPAYSHGTTSLPQAHIFFFYLNLPSSPSK